MEHTHAWWADRDKLRIQFERGLDIHRTLLSLACSFICLFIGGGLLAALRANDCFRLPYVLPRRPRKGY